MTIAATVLVVVLVAAAAMVPLAVSTDLVRDRLERDISEWTGHRVSLGTNPKLSYWPAPSIRLQNVTIGANDGDGTEPLAFAERVTASFGAVSALLGNPDFTSFEFLRPVFRVSRRPDGSLDWSSRSGRIAEAIAAARKLAEREQANAADSAELKLPSNELGRIIIREGALEWTDEASGRTERLSSLEGDLDWGRLDTGLRLTLAGIFRGESIKVSLTTPKPLLLLAGGNADIDTQLTSAPLSMTFSGAANFSEMPFFGGKLGLSTPSMRKALQWSGTDIKPGEAIGSLKVDAQVTTKTDRINLDNLIIDLDDNRGIGVLDLIVRKDNKPAVAGTLAFNRLNITSFLRAFTPLPKSGEAIATTIDTRFLSQLGLDLRLSAQTASMGPLTMTDLAAAARIGEGRAIFDIGDANAYGGTVVGKIQILENGLDGGGGVQLSARRIDFGKVFDAMTITGPMPRGIGTLDLELKSGYPLWATRARDLKGEIAISMENGSVPAFDLAAFRALSETERFFDLGRVSGDSFAFNSARFDAVFSNGLAEITRGEIVGGNTRIDLTGVIPFEKASLAMAGTLSPVQAEESANAPAPAEPETSRFFIGGSWPAPVISPVIDTPLDE